MSYATKQEALQRLSSPINGGRGVVFRYADSGRWDFAPIGSAGFEHLEANARTKSRDFVPGRIAVEVVRAHGR